MMVVMNDLTGQLAVLIERGGVVMVPLLFLSVVSLTLIVERVWFWIAVHRPGRRRLIQTLNETLRAGNHKAAKGLVASDRSPYGIVVRRLLEHGTGDAVAVEAVEAVRPKLDRFMVSLSTIITAAPLLGILGTVVGIIQSFRLLGEGADSLSDPSAVSAGIAEALLTTALGLVVALVTLFPYMIFRGQLERAMGRMESVIAAAQQGGGEGGTSRSR
jgi:biopolymer transport protein ExbB